MYHCLWNQGSVGTTLTLLFVRLFMVCCSNQRTWVGSSVVGGRQSLPSTACGSLDPCNRLLPTFGSFVRRIFQPQCLLKAFCLVPRCLK